MDESPNLMPDSDAENRPDTTEKKRQHYVPRCYLRQFSIQGDEVRIGIYVVESGKFIPAGALSKQAYANFFYGEDGFIEDALEKLEGAAAPILKRIAIERAIPRLSREERGSLLTFIAILGARTKGVVEANEEVFAKGLSLAFGAGAEAASDQAGGRPASILASLNAALKMMPLYSDLTCKLLVNSGVIPFITSDDPVIRYNQFLEERTSRQAISSLNFRGIQVFVPVSPSTCLMLYDSAVYGCGFKDSDIVEVEQEDVLELNRLQMASADRCTYFDHTVSEGQIASIVRLTKGLRRPESGAEEIKKDGKTVIRLFRASLRAGLKLSFSRVLRRARRWDLSNETAIVRNLEFERALTQLTRQRQPSISAPDGSGKQVNLRVVPPLDV